MQGDALGDVESQVTKGPTRAGYTQERWQSPLQHSRRGQTQHEQAAGMQLAPQTAPQASRHD